MILPSHLCTAVPSSNWSALPSWSYGKQAYIVRLWHGFWLEHLIKLPCTQTSALKFGRFRFSNCSVTNQSTKANMHHRRGKEKQQQFIHADVDDVLPPAAIESSSRCNFNPCDLQATCWTACCWIWLFVLRHYNSHLYLLFATKYYSLIKMEPNCIRLTFDVY